MNFKIEKDMLRTPLNSLQQNIHPEFLRVLNVPLNKE